MVCTGKLVRTQKKIVRAISGKVYDVIIDMRKNSKTYLKWDCRNII